MDYIQADEIHEKSYDGTLMRRILAYLRPYRAKVAFSILLLVFVSLFQLAPPFLLKLAIDRFLVSDGSLDIYIQAQSPGKDKEANWLPSPKDGTLGLTMCIYAPKRSVLEGTWSPPVLKRVGGKAAPARLGDGLPSHK